ncbi:DNA-3-methyladenine glycosylase 2 family protein [Mycobacterium sp. MYCO198283]|uniref:DNA-3-methyladenine glycosylase 2 family protein n=1 Tax=Mycobacterium sp. MYCO198283 TaxID=2883505 RepID=UPI0027E16F49|nr:DNA-3-methyladenine glycosylase 2 family protein [Mycobacterium sp. MYCO198283]
MHDDFDRCYKALQSRDARFDGWFVTAVTSTGIYCRPSCPARTPHARNVRFYPSAAAAQHAGFRACKRCRPDASPGSPQWNVRGDVVARAMRLIGDGVVDRDGVTGLAAALGYTTRQLERLLRAEVGAGPLALARAQRVQTARILIETTDLPFSEVAFASGFASIRQFNDSVRDACAASPTALRYAARTRSAAATGPAAGVLSLRLPVRTPFAYRGLFGHLGAAAVPGCEEVRDGAYRRTLRLPHGVGVVALTPATDHVRCELQLDDFRDLAAAIARCRRLLDLDADPTAVTDALAADPTLRSAVAAAPGQRIPRTVDEHELAIRTVLGQQVSMKAARTHTARLVHRYGRPLAAPVGGLSHAFPTVDELAALDPAELAMPHARRRTLIALIGALADGRVDLGPGVDWNRARGQLGELPGVGPWTVEMVAMRGLGDPDAFPASDLGIRLSARAFGLPDDVRALSEHSARWRPWRAYAAQQLWAALDHSVNDWPPKETACPSSTTAPSIAPSGRSRSPAAAAG